MGPILPLVEVSHVGRKLLGFQEYRSKIQWGWTLEKRICAEQTHKHKNLPEFFFNPYSKCGSMLLPEKKIRSKGNLMYICMYILNHCSTVNANHHTTFYEQKYHIKGQTILKPGYTSDYSDNSVHSLLFKMDTLGGNSYSWLIIIYQLCDLNFLCLWVSLFFLT